MATLTSALSVSHSSTPQEKLSPFPLLSSKKMTYHYPLKQRLNSSVMDSRRLRVKAASEDDANSEDPSVPSWARAGSDELPPWARDEAQKESSTFEVPYIVYLLASAVTAIAAIGSVFEYANKSPVFGVLDSDSVFYAPVLGFFVFTGIPSAAFLWFKSVEIANKEAEEQDRRDGYL